MKTNFINCLYLLALGCLLLVSCKKDDPAGLGEETDKVKILFINAAPNGPTKPSRTTGNIGIYPYYNGVTFNNTPINFPHPNGYKAFAPGTMTIRLDTAYMKDNNTPPERASEVARITFPTQADEYYTLYAVGTVSAVVGAQTVEPFLLRDNIKPLPTAGKVKVRIMNFSPNSSPLDVVITRKAGVAAPQVLATGLAFKGVKDFFEIDPGVYEMQVRAAGTTTGLVTKGNMIIDANSYYSIWVGGFQATVPAVPGPALSIQYHANRWSNPLVK